MDAHDVAVLNALTPIGRVPDAIRCASDQYRAMHADHRGDTVRYAILDCSGTAMDRYVDAPALVFVAVFKSFDVSLTMAEAREPMGLRKDLHVRRLLELPTVEARWREVHGRPPTDDDAARLFERFVPMQLEVLRTGDHATLLPGTRDTAAALQAAGIQLGITTGFTREMLDILLERGRDQGFAPDTSVAGDEVESARPLPFMVLKNLERLGVQNIGNALRRTVKVDDTITGAGEGAPLCWTVAVTRWGNYVVDSRAHAASLTPDELAARERAAKARLVRESAAHYVIDDLRDLPAVVDDINDRLGRGETPWLSVF